jgi:hypothetical protein
MGACVGRGWGIPEVDLHDERHGDVECDEVHDEGEEVVEEVGPHRAVVGLIGPQLRGRKEWLGGAGKGGEGGKNEGRMRGGRGERF